jgi:8-oxo-dGTP pyrophosphatase MutT (NUDIX family)
MKVVSAGIIIKCPSGILMTHPNEKPFKEGNFDIPKGHVEDGEDYFETCARELKEETGIDIKELSKEASHPIKDEGLFPYIKKKDLYLFSVELPNDIDVGELKCTSLFKSNRTGEMIPECDWYILSNDLEMLYPNLKKVITKLNIDGLRWKA